MVGEPNKSRWDRVMGKQMDMSLPCLFCRHPAIGASGGLCYKCMMDKVYIAFSLYNKHGKHR